MSDASIYLLAWLGSNVNPFYLCRHHLVDRSTGYIGVYSGVSRLSQRGRPMEASHPCYHLAAQWKKYGQQF